MPENMKETAACDRLSWPLPLGVKDALQRHGTSARPPAAPPPAVPPISPRTKPEQMVIKSISVVAAGASSSPGRPRSGPGTPAPTMAHRATSWGQPAPTEACAIGMPWNRILLLLADQLDWPKLLRGVAKPRATGSQSHGLLISHRVSEYETAEPAEDHTVSL